MTKKILDLTIAGKWFDKILDGTKKIEYRDIKPYWTNRLLNKNGSLREFDEIRFRNGYSRNCRKMYVEFLGLNKSETHYGILLGRIISKNC